MTTPVGSIRCTFRRYSCHSLLHPTASLEGNQHYKAPFEWFDCTGRLNLNSMFSNRRARSRLRLCLLRADQFKLVLGHHWSELDGTKSKYSNSDSARAVLGQSVNLLEWASYARSLVRPFFSCCTLLPLMASSRHLCVLLISALPENCQILSTARLFALATAAAAAQRAVK